MTVHRNSNSCIPSPSVAVIKAFGSKYLGNAHLAMIKAIDDAHSMDHRANYIKSVVATQSSGSGKSKLADEVAKMRITLLLCLREDLGRDSFGTKNEQHCEVVH